jgi:hypothetical protein
MNSAAQGDRDKTISHDKGESNTVNRGARMPNLSNIVTGEFFSGCGCRDAGKRNL